jgi:excisionase family DNA binding protein
MPILKEGRKLEKATMSVPEMAKRLGVSRSLGYELVKSGQVPALKLGIKRLVVPVYVVERMLEEAGSCAR